MKRTLLYGIIFLLPLYGLSVPAQAQTANSQQTLNQYVADLQSNPSDTALRGKIIALALTMRPAPAIPEEARGHYVMATTFAEKAKSDTERAKNDSDLKLANAGFERAVAEYKAALLVAPWWADAYKKLAIAQKAAAQYDDAMASLNLYLLTQPADARDAQDEIYKLRALKQSAVDDQANQARRQQEEQQRQREEQQRAYAASPEGQFQSLLKKIDGRRYTFPRGQITLVIDVKGNDLVQGTIRNYTTTPDYYENGRYEIQGRETTVPVDMDHTGEQFWTVQKVFTISEDGYRITMRRYFNNGHFDESILSWQR
jgi:tetratricopeptide (TPR) repeat protein